MPKPAAKTFNHLVDAPAPEPPALDLHEQIDLLAGKLAASDEALSASAARLSDERRLRLDAEARVAELTKKLAEYAGHLRVALPSCRW